MGSTGISDRSVSRRILDAGVLIRDYDENATAAVNIADASKLVGATAGIEITITAEITNTGADLDGAPGKLKGFDRVTNEEATITGTLKEHTVASLLDMLPGCEATVDGAETTIARVRRHMADADYLDNLAWIGDTPAADGSVGIIIYSPLATGELSLSPTKNEDAGLDYTMEARHDPADLTAPVFKVLYPSDVSGGS